MMTYNPYIMQMQPQGQMQDIGGLTPVYQNIANQQAMQNAALAQQNQLTQQAGQTAQGGFNPMAMAAALRKKDQTDGTKQTGASVVDYSRPMPNYLDPAYMEAGY
jgi:hypothetical protein